MQYPVYEQGPEFCMPQRQIQLDFFSFCASERTVQDDFGLLFWSAPIAVIVLAPPAQVFVDGAIYVDRPF